MPIRTFGEVIERAAGLRRAAALLGGSLAPLAFAVALGGLTGSVLRSLGERRRELSIRSALGATPPHFVRLMASPVLLLTGIGFVLRLAGAFATERVLRGLIAGVRPHDMTTVAAVAMLDDGRVLDGGVRAGEARDAGERGRRAEAGGLTAYPYLAE